MTRSLRLLRRLTLSAFAAWLTACVILAAVIHRTGAIDEARDADVIVVLGAALSRDGTPYRALTRRSEHAAGLWKAGHAATIICTGGVGRSLTRSEADGCREVLLREGVPERAIVLEETSRNTKQNAHHAKTIMDAHGWRTAIVVSDSYHVFRARRVVSSAGVDVLLSPVPMKRIDSPAFYVFSILRELAALHRQVFIPDT